MQVLYPNVGSLLGMGLVRTALVDCTVHLFSNDATLGPGTVVGDLTECTFGGYAEKTVAALLPAYIDPLGGASAQIATVQWDHSGSGTDELVYGFWVETDGGDLFLCGKFDEPIPMGSVGDSIPLDVKFNFGR